MINLNVSLFKLVLYSFLVTKKQRQRKWSWYSGVQYRQSRPRRNTIEPRVRRAKAKKLHTELHNRWEKNRVHGRSILSFSFSFFSLFYSISFSFGIMPSFFTDSLFLCLYISLSLPIYLCLSLSLCLLCLPLLTDWGMLFSARHIEIFS